MTRDRAINIVLGCIIAALVMNGGTIELLGIVLICGLVLGALVGAAFVYGERGPQQ